MRVRCARRGVASLFVAVCLAFSSWGTTKVWAQPAPSRQPGAGAGEIDLARLGEAERRALRMDTIVRAVRRARPAVVAIAATNAQTNRSDSGGQGSGAGSGGGEVQIGIGSGVVVHADGYVVTNAHVIGNSNQIKVRLADGRIFNARVVGKAEPFDIAVVKIESSVKLPVAVLGSSKDLFHGESVIAIGTPFGLTTTVSRGVISALHRRLKVRDRNLADFLQTDAAVNPGNSGGPLVNVLGEVVGINTAVHKGGPGIGFAIPIDRVKGVLQDLMTFGYVRGIYLGLSVVGQAGGVRVVRVDPGSPASGAGIQVGDVVQQVGDEETANMGTFHEALMALMAGQQVQLRLRRGRVTIVPIMLTPVRARRLMEDRMGLTLGNATTNAARLGIQAKSGAVVLRVRPGGPAARVGIAIGDVIVQADRYQVFQLKHMDWIAARVRNIGKLHLVLSRQSRTFSVDLVLR